jgi:peptide/nickel transport system substrate-binding protein
VPGGIYQGYAEQDIEGMDPHAAGSVQTITVANFSYLRLLKKKTNFSGISTNEPVGDLAESWEFSPDGLQLTMKLRQGVIWDRRAPTNGRAVDAQDVKFSVGRFLAKSPYASNYFNSKSKAAPITSIEYPDTATLVMKLAFPYVPLLATLSRALNIWVIPHEADGGFDPKTDARGAGPWILDSYRPSVGLEFKHNPDYYVKGRPFLDGWSMPIVPEYATQLAQIRAANIWGMVPKQEDVLQLKKDLPQISMYQADYGTDSPLLYFGFQGPFKDLRLRQAVSYMVDRQLVADTISDSAKFEAAGLPKAVRINSHIGAGWPEWLDPFGKDFGPNAKYFQENLVEAKKLVAAAGITGKPSVKFYYPMNGYNAVYQQTVQIVAQMLNQTGIFDIKLMPVDYQTEYIPKIHFGGDHAGAWDGISLTPAAQGDDAGHQLQVQFHSQGAATRQPPGEDPKLDQMIDAQLRETDPKKRAQLIQDTQRYLPETMIATPVFYQAAGYGLTWPWVGNAGTARSSVTGPVPAAETYPYLWFDKANYSKNKP